MEFNEKEYCFQKLFKVVIWTAPNECHAQSNVMANNENEAIAVVKNAFGLEPPLGMMAEAKVCGEVLRPRF